MHQVYINIVISAILEQFDSENHFYTEQLGISEFEWLNWKEGKVNLSSDNLQKIKGLFSDYEWMLLQKILRQSVLFPEKRNVAVNEYKRLKVAIAQKWLENKLATVDLIAPTKEDEEKRVPYIHLRVAVNYGEWGFDDIISFRLPAAVQQQIEGSEVPLLDWANENLLDTYIKE
ncbi:hypothetical protein M2139_002193 [Enterococcus sp. PF1-24]|uniref:hypothetical protein n=1 Tax=unclassified Enterococcus TaxID=2608891 RepID=UPI0024732846|nr:MULTISPECIES: hypothetical protein [unclassified Enterococcus]MDH6365191.1 hypothetical protein [Enterococcus sp. PFB1-1]MDH6402292.1 hypothetical protein [Enterococcus sp. PF1-24]